MEVAPVSPGMQDPGLQGHLPANVHYLRERGLHVPVSPGR